MTSVDVEVRQDTFPTEKAKKQNYIYLAVVVGFIVISIIVPPPFGSSAGMLLGIAGLIYGIILRKKARKDNPGNNIGKLGIWLSLVWAVLNFFVFLIAAALILTVGFIANLITVMFG